MSGVLLPTTLILKDTFARWSRAWSTMAFRWFFLAATGILLLIGLNLGEFFQFIQGRQGNLVHDKVLEWFPVYDLSLFILFCIYSPLVYILVTGFLYPEILWKFVVGFALIHVFRIISLYLLPLEPPVDLVPLYDPLANVFYKKEIIDKDLFFSGHTATVFWIYFCAKSGRAKFYILLSNLALVVMLLIQHIHYTIDILGAILVTFFLRFSLEYYIMLLKQNSKWLEYE